MISCDFLVIGSGVAGLYFSILAAEIGSVVIATKSNLSAGATPLAQGGVAASISPTDSPEKHFNDTLIAGAGLCDKEAVHCLVYEGVTRMEELIQWGMEFSRNESGKLDLGLEGGHSENRILHSKDHTGFDLQEFLLKKVLSHKNITILENHMAVDIITEHHVNQSNQPKQAYGAYVLDIKKNVINTIQAKTTCLATGGAGRVYPYTTNPPVSTGDGIAIAYRAGCSVRNLEFIQFHPTALFSTSEQAFLISEAVRGKGGKLQLEDGTEFMSKYHEKAELASRDIVARAIDIELKISGSDHIYLDVTHLPSKTIKTEFPQIYNTLKEKHNIDMTCERIPVVPAAHYICGGVQTDINGKTKLNNLYALGETASTGVHGANRLASNSLLESIVFTARAVLDIKSKETSKTNLKKISIPLWREKGVETFSKWGIIKHHRSELKKIMWNYIGIERSVNRLNRALKIIDLIYEEILDYYKNFKLNHEILELRNIALVSQLIVRSAASRKETRGLHIMSDFPENRGDSRKDTILKPSIQDID